MKRSKNFLEEVNSLETLIIVSLKMSVPILLDERHLLRSDSNYTKLTTSIKSKNFSIGVSNFYKLQQTFLEFFQFFFKLYNTNYSDFSLKK